MKLLRTIWNPALFEWKNFETRHTARAILFGEDRKIAILHVGKYNYHKLPGGWIEEWENAKEALRRECLEEVWSEIEIGISLGEIREYRADLFWEQWDYMLQISECFVCQITNLWPHNFTESELENNFSHRWFTLGEAIRILENDTPENKEWKFIQERELAFLKKAHSLNIYNS